MKFEMTTPVQNASGRVFSNRKTISTRTVNGHTFSYNWPEDYQYPIIPKRVRQTILFRMAIEESKTIYSNPEELERYKRDYAANPGKFHNLRGFIISICRARIDQQLTDEMVEAEMQRKQAASSNKRKR